MIVLSLDTCLGACSAAVVEDGRVLAQTIDGMWRGHQERLGSLVRHTVAQAGGFARLDRIGVTVGPGSFTGLRVGIAFAKGLGLALERPVVGVGTLEAMALDIEGLSLALIDARRGQAYWQAFEDGRRVNDPAVSPLETITGFAARTLVGPGAPLLAASYPFARVMAMEAPEPVTIASIAAGREPAPIKPLYLRAPDAKLPGGIEPFA